MMGGMLGTEMLGSEILGRETWALILAARLTLRAKGVWTRMVPTVPVPIGGMVTVIATKPSNPAVRVM
jgi:hypothetical protein